MSWIPAGAPRRLLPVLVLVLASALRLDAAAWLPVSRAEAREYLVTKGITLDQPVQDGLMSEALEQIRQLTLLALAWNRDGRELTADQLEQLRLAKEEAAVRLAREGRMKVEPVDENDRQDYEFLARSLYLTSHILVDERALADSLAALLEKGADFAALARRFSADPGSAELGGSLGWVEMGQTVMEFEDAMTRLRPGQASPPVETPYGWHLIRLDSLVEREIEFSGMDKTRQLEALARNARRRAELQAREWLWREHAIELFRPAAVGAGVAPETVVARTADTTLTRAQLDGMVRRAFGGAAGAGADGLGWDILRYWVERDAWLREARKDGTWTGKPLERSVELQERLLKSSLVVAEDILPRMVPSDEDLWNYLQTHENEFLAERSFGVWAFEFPTRAEAEAARALSRKEKLGPDLLAKRLGLDLHPFELSAAEVRELPKAQRDALIEIFTDEWSDIVDNGQTGTRQRWLFYNLVGRRMPDIDESRNLAGVVREKVRTLMVDAEIARVVREVEARTGLTQARWED